ncbi:WhiB family transcriptional regulator [Streptomyces sp. AD55]|uniref:WhiB family transcriptional regulator n=1 Tax=Streptomyces sp. AD55 TaxID=3242895 RepID=UPI003527A005
MSIFPRPKAPISLPLPPHWSEHAACSLEEAGLFFPADGDTITLKEAKAVCSGCRVQSDCRRSALDRGEQHGVWGGLSERERRALLRKERDQ